MRRKIMISRGKVGLNIYFCEEAAAAVGGPKAPVTVGSELAVSGERVITVRRGGPNHVNAHRSPVHPFRTMARDLWPEGERIDDIPLFAPVSVDWRMEDGVLTALIPSEKQLELPIRRAPRVQKRVAPLTLQQVYTARDVARVLLELNTILASDSPELADLRWAYVDAGGTTEDMAEPRRIFATRQEVLG